MYRLADAGSAVKNEKNTGKHIKAQSKVPPRAHASGRSQIECHICDMSKFLIPSTQASCRGTRARGRLTRLHFRSKMCGLHAEPLCAEAMLRKRSAGDDTASSTRVQWSMRGETHVHEHDGHSRQSRSLHRSPGGALERRLHDARAATNSATWSSASPHLRRLGRGGGLFRWPSSPASRLNHRHDDASPGFRCSCSPAC